MYVKVIERKFLRKGVLEKLDEGCQKYVDCALWRELMMFDFLSLQTKIESYPVKYIEQLINFSKS